jgi:hypothetical protein
VNRPRTGHPARYARAIERSWSALLEQPVVLSRRDWALIEGWYARRIPLEIVEEALVAANERDRERRRPRRLAEVARSVDEAWEVVLDGRRGVDPVTEGPPATPPVSLWRERFATEPTGSPLGQLLGALLGRLDSGASAKELDDTLDERLLEAVTSGVREKVESDVEREIEPYRSRMPADRWEATRRRACVERLRRRLQLPRLADRDPRA